MLANRVELIPFKKSGSAVAFFQQLDMRRMGNERRFMLGGEPKGPTQRRQLAIYCGIRGADLPAVSGVAAGLRTFGLLAAPGDIVG